jgi:hypothetical protein
VIAELVIAGGRLVDPLTGFDAVADVGVTAVEGVESHGPPHVRGAQIVEVGREA